MKSQKPSNHCQPPPKIRPLAAALSEVIPDSEEERQHKEEHTNDLHIAEVIEISSDESASEGLKTTLRRFTTANLSTDQYQTPRKGLSRPNYSIRRIIESSDEDSAPEIIELSDSDSSIQSRPAKRGSMKLRAAIDPPPSPTHSTVDDSIIIFDEPRSARTPLRIGRKDTGPATVPKSEGARNPNSVKLGASVSTPEPSGKKKTASTSERRSQARLRLNTKRALLEAELKRRKEYAQILFTDLNELVFKQGLPANTQLNWSKRLLTTAGRAKFHRSREGIQTTEIELAEKILDCDERIRNTLSHEMCHLATWVIDKKVDEHHGRLFKSWASLIMKKRPDIHVLVKHDYKISYPFEWKCEKCAKIYGRFSKSIRPDECVCGACKEGTLIPLFTTRTPSKKAIKFSRMEAAKPQDSPISAQGTLSKGNGIDSSDSNGSEIENLADIFAVTGIRSEEKDV